MPEPVSPPPALVRCRAALLDALAVVSPTSCCGCGAPDRALCAGCAASLVPRTRTIQLDGLSVAFAHDYAGTVRQALAAFKDGGRTDAAGHLAPSLRASVATALRLAEGPVPAAEAAAPVHLAAVPSSRAAHRARGYTPVGMLLRRAGLRGERLLAPSRAARDQVGLSAAARRSNRDGWLVARGRARGARVLIVDDILTTGATLREARRALESAGAEVIGAAVLAHTPLRRGGFASPTGDSARTVEGIPDGG